MAVLVCLCSNVSSPWCHGLVCNPLIVAFPGHSHSFVSPFKTVNV